MGGRGARQSLPASMVRGAAHTLVLQGWPANHRSSHPTIAMCHGACVLSRQGRWPDGQMGVQKAGRPVGFLLAWLANNDHENKEGHWCPEFMKSLSVEERSIRRAAIMSEPSGEQLMSYERLRRDGEAEEPPDLEDYVKRRGPCGCIRCAA